MESNEKPISPEPQPNGTVPADAVAETTVSEANTTPSPEVDIEAMRRELEEARSKAAEYLDGWQRARAEFANYKKRQEQQNAEIRAFATLDLVRRLLPILDDFDRALKTMPPSLVHLTWVEGVMLIHRKLQVILEAEGVKPIEVKPGDAFDPNLHEAVSQDEAEGIESGHIIEELQKGYTMNNRVIRPTLVRVAK
ncbi:MAG: nucleotide exchange factor GrpE [Anaerolineae bacterium]|nr:nucleotide exchange factor GrpE [Thermoflexales bacterium]MCX7939796.1 nucleotide exchange factor GrpE [Thermoflexales bacterium]MDW8053577.1 nucleotide exchange factor GrpE [Anaerolineae bacterium]MDW8292127.1 nucleotide exchange factor GrpE [Anaerolineae bacterium]